ncbi:MAG: hypothetical protein LBS42_07740 [Tannerella sp.]|jgi:hypothetical protein|nr:hypothetical protein [Tannerella sp.]
MVKPVVIFHPSVVEYLDTLGKQLFDNEYFGYRENAVQYIQRMVDYIASHIHLQAAIPAPEYFEKYGSHLKYITYHSTKRTTWYIFFQHPDHRFLIRHITNNHVEGQHIR